MPALDAGMQQNTAGNFQYSATKLNELGATEYTLVSIISDVSGSVLSFKDEMEIALKESVKACKYSPRADNLMLRHVKFNDYVAEGHGFKLLSQINDSDYDNSLRPSGSTALFDGVLNGVQSTGDYAKTLVAASFNVNGVIFIITDGDNNTGIATVKMVKDSLAAIQKDESLESLVTILVAVNVNDPYMSGRLQAFQKDAGISQYVELKDASKKSLAKLAAFVSKSISAQSQALGTGGPSKQLTSGSLVI